MSRFTLDGRIAVYLLTTLPSTPTAPTQAEIAAGTNLVGTKQAEELVDIQGFEAAPTSLPTPGYAGPLTGQVSGELTYPDGVLSWYKDSASSTIYSLMVVDLDAFIFIAQDGLGSGEEGQLFPVLVADRNRRKARNAPNIFDVTMNTGVPYECVQAA
jgi:hypothetical protein